MFQNQSGTLSWLGLCMMVITSSISSLKTSLWESVSIFLRTKWVYYCLTSFLAGLAKVVFFSPTVLVSRTHKMSWNSSTRGMVVVCRLPMEDRCWICEEFVSKSLGQEQTNYGPWAKSGLLLLFVNKVLLQWSLAHLLMTYFVLWQHFGEVATESIWPAKACFYQV